MKKESIIEWKITRHKNTTRSGIFYGGILVIMILLLLFSIWQDNLLFGVFIVLAVGTILFISTQAPDLNVFKLTDKKLTIDGKTEYEYERFVHYDIHHFGEEDQEIFFVFRERLKPILRIRIHSKDEGAIEELLSQKLPRKKTEPSLIDLFSKIVGI